MYVVFAGGKIIIMNLVARVELSSLKTNLQSPIFAAQNGI